MNHSYKKKPSKKVREYARRLWDADKSDTKQVMALEAGYSPSQARIPQRIEQTMGFRLATAEIATLAQNATMAMMYEITARQQSGEMRDYPLEKLISLAEKLSTVTDRFSKSRESNENPLKAVVREIWASNG